MTGRPITSAAKQLDWLLADLLQRIPDSRTALLLASDGLRKAAAGLTTDQADHLSAIASGLFSLARSAGEQFGGSPGVRQVITELDDMLLFVSTAGTGSLLAVTVGRGANPKQVGFEMMQLVKSVQPHLETPDRPQATGSGETMA